MLDGRVERVHERLEGLRFELKQSLVKQHVRCLASRRVQDELRAVLTEHGSCAVDQLSPMLRASTRPIASLAVKGKGDDVAVCEVIWQGGEELTTMAAPSAIASVRQISLRLQLGATVLLLDQARAGIVLGRDAACEMVVADRMASRQHARIERRGDKFFLIDQSSNGTYVAFAGAEEVALRREETMLRGSGRIAFGRSVALSDDDTLAFAVMG